jgi:hypothetical protein
VRPEFFESRAYTNDKNSLLHILSARPTETSRNTAMASPSYPTFLLGSYPVLHYIVWVRRGLILPRARTKVRIPNLGLAVAQPAAAHWRSAGQVSVNSGISLEG